VATNLSRWSHAHGRRQVAVPGVVSAGHIHFTGGVETTSAAGDCGGSVNLTRSKVKRGAGLRARFLRERLRAARPMLAGRPHEAAGNGSPRWMAAGPRKRVHRDPAYRPTRPF
jgi:hypothetical protein